MRIAKLVLLTLLGRSLSAQQPLWTATLTSGLEAFTGDGSLPSSWLWEDARVEHKHGRTSLAAEGVVSRRYDQWDQAAIGDVYAGTTATGYFNVRALFTPSAKVLPSSDLSGELFQGFSNGWEGSVAARRMSYSTGGTTIVSGGIARSFGNEYVRARYVGLVGQGTSAGSAVITARHFGTSADDFVEGGLATGHEVVNIGPNQTYDIRPSTSGYVRAQYFLTPHIGVGGLGSLANQRGIPNRLGAYLNTMVRW